MCMLTSWAIVVMIFCPNSLVPKTHGLAESAGVGGSNAKVVHELGQIGHGVNIGLISKGNIRTTHEAFFDKDPNGEPTGSTHAFNYDFTGDGINIVNHDTWVAGIVAGRGGAEHPNDIGIAPGAEVHTARVTNNNDDPNITFIAQALDELITVCNCRIIVTGFQIADTADGQSNWALLYDYYACSHNVIFANPAGNSGSEVAIFGDTYNGITTGGLILRDPGGQSSYRKVGPESGSGPTDDGRRKPDITAPSQAQTIPSGGSDTTWLTWSSGGGQTSFSAPHTAGVAALLLGLADDTAEANDNQNEVIKAVIVNSAFPNVDDKTGSSTNPADPNNTWNPDRGYGRIDASRAYQLLNAPQISTDEVITQRKGWAYATIGQNEQHCYFITGEKNHRLVLTVTWNRYITKSELTYNEETSPKFNLTLTIKNSMQDTIFVEADTLNNLKKLDLILPGNDTYEIIVRNTSNKSSRSYALAFELLEPIPGDFEPTDYIVDGYDLLTLAKQWLLVAPDLEADLIANGIVDSPDFAALARHWLEIDPVYYQEQ